MVECLTLEGGFEPHRQHYVVSLSKNINRSLVLVQPRKTCPFITERLLIWRKESNQTKQRAVSVECIIQLFGYCMATWYAMSLSPVKLTEIGFSCGHGHSDPIAK